MGIFKQLLPRTFGCFCYQWTLRASISFFHSSPNTSVKVHSQEQEVVIALGSNVGDRLHNFNEALHMLKQSGISVIRHGCLYETEPAYVTNQPLFLNSAIRAITKLGPHELLGVLKRIEKDMGRIDGIRYGPRPIDLDILFYGKFKVKSENLTIPHERIWERPFVMAPLLDLLGTDVESDTVACWHALSLNSRGIFESWENFGGESLIGKDGLKRVLPVANQLWDWSEKTSVMGVLNVTPDSFSDGGKFLSVEAAVSQVRSTVADLNVPYIAMHMRGDPITMQSEENLKYDNVCVDVALELYERVSNAEKLGIPAWRIIIDPGIGFSKGTGHNLDILMGLKNIRTEIARKSLGLSRAPMMIGPSRKKFLGEICNRAVAVERDSATIASVTTGVLNGANIVRLHNVGDNMDAVKLCDAMMGRMRSG